jgi:hypothetical protein
MCTLVDLFLAANPEKARDPAELQEMDAGCAFTDEMVPIFPSRSVFSYAICIQLRTEISFTTTTSTVSPMSAMNVVTEEPLSEEEESESQGSEDDSYVPYIPPIAFGMPLPYQLPLPPLSTLPPLPPLSSSYRSYCRECIAPGFSYFACLSGDSDSLGASPFRTRRPQVST